MKTKWGCMLRVFTGSTAIRALKKGLDQLANASGNTDSITAAENAIKAATEQLGSKTFL
jgi:hypothetical protein